MGLESGSFRERLHEIEDKPWGMREFGVRTPDVVLLPIDADKVDVRPIVRDEVLYVSADPEHTRQPATIERLAARGTHEELLEQSPLYAEIAEKGLPDQVFLNRKPQEAAA